MKFKNLYIIAFLGFFLLSCDCGNSKTKNRSNLGFYKNTETVISTLEKQKKDAEEHFMLGLRYKSQKKLKKSLFHFLNSSFQSHRVKKIKLYSQPIYSFLNGFHFKSDYYYDSIFEISSILYSFREHKYVIKISNLIKNDNTVLYRNTILLKAKSFSALKKYDDATSELKTIRDEYNDKASQMIINIRLASIYQASKQIKKAIKTHLKVIDLKLESWQAGISASQIMKIVSKNNITISKKEKIKIAKALYFNKKYSDILNILKNSQDTESKIIYFKSLVRLNKKTNFLTFLKKHKNKINFYYKLQKSRADILWLIGKKYKAIKLYKQMLKSEEKQDSLKKIALFLEDRRSKNYKNYLNQYIKLYPENKTSEYFTWLLARNNIKDKQYNVALNLLQKNLKQFPNGKYSDRNRFWLYYIYNKKNKTIKSLYYLKDLVTHNPDSSYTWALLKTLQKKFSIETLKNNIKSALKKNNYKDIHFYNFILYSLNKEIQIKDLENNTIKKLNKISNDISNLKLYTSWSSKLKNLEKYFKIGYLKGIKREISIIPNNIEIKKDVQTSLIYYSKIYKNYNISVNSALQILKLNNLKEDISIMPENLVKSLFPFAFKKDILRNSKKYKLNPFVILSVIKAESLFNPNAISSVYATGLMQIMPATAKDIAKNIKMKKYNLKNPSTSITFGSYYLTWLNKYYKGNLPLMVAGYNAGAGNVNKWIKKLDKNNALYFAEFVPFVETRYYILRTGKFFNQYKIIYKKL